MLRCRGLSGCFEMSPAALTESGHTPSASKDGRYSFPTQPASSGDALAACFLRARKVATWCILTHQGQCRKTIEAVPPARGGVATCLESVPPEFCDTLVSGYTVCPFLKGTGDGSGTGTVRWLAPAQKMVRLPSQDPHGPGGPVGGLWRINYALPDT